MKQGGVHPSTTFRYGNKSLALPKKAFGSSEKSVRLFRNKRWALPEQPCAMFVDEARQTWLSNVFFAPTPNFEFNNFEI